MTEEVFLAVPPNIREVENSGKPFIVYALDARNSVLYRTQVPAIESEDIGEFEKALKDSGSPLIVARSGNVGMCSVQVNKDIIELKGIVKVEKLSPVSIFTAVALKVKPNELYIRHYCPDSDVGFIHIKGKVKGTGALFNVIVARQQDIFSGRDIINREDYPF